MARSLRRTSKQSWRVSLPAALGFLLFLALLALSLAEFVLSRDQLRHQDALEQHVQQPLRHSFARQPEEQAAKIQDPAAAAAATPVVEGLEPRAAIAPGPAPAPARTIANSSSTITWNKHTGKSCQNYAEEHVTDRSLTASKVACLANEVCVAIECPHGSESSCTLRAIANLVDYAPADCYELVEVRQDGRILTARVHPAYNSLTKEYPFQAVRTQAGNEVNIILVRSPVNMQQHRLYQKYKDEILFLGISSMNDYPLKQQGDEFDYLGMFPGFLHMMREPEKHFPPHVKTILMSQSDFSLPRVPPRDYSVPKKYDFTYSASDCDVYIDGRGWCGWSKNWSFVKEALVVMCGEYHLTGVLVATKDKSGARAYTIPGSCKGKVIQTTYLPRQSDYFDYLKQSRFAFLPQIHDASPRVATQALAHDVPVLMNYYILGGWKYVNDKTGEFFHDMSDFRQSLDKILKNSDIPGRYEPRKWVLERYDDAHSGKRLLDFVQEHFSDRVRLPKGTKLLLP